MKKIFLTALLLSSYFSNAQSSLLNADFWKSNSDLNSVKTEIAKGNSPSEANRGNHDVVSIAINNNAPLETIIYLIEQEGNSIDKTTHDGRLYIHWAASRGNLELVNYLIKQGSDINRTDDKGAIALSFAASNGQVNPEIYKAFFDAGLDPKQKFQNGANFMLLAIGYDTDLKLSEYLITKGLSLNDTDSNGNTTFDYAARSGNVAILKALKNKGIKPTNKALIFASEGTRSFSNTLENYKFLVEDLKLNPKATGDNGENVLHNLVKKKDQEIIIAYFLDKGVDVNQANKEGNTVLMEVVKGSDVKLFETILSNTKNINQVNHKGLSALSFAVSNGSADMISALLANKADAKIKDKEDKNLAYYLVQSYRALRPNQKDEFSDKIQILKNAGVDFKSTQGSGSTLLHVAVLKNDVKLLSSLEEFNIDINAKDDEGMTVLHKAALLSKDDVVLKYLISKGADKTIQTDFEETVYNLASENESLIDSKINIDFLK